MIKYSRARVIFLIIAVIALWIAAKCSMPYVEKREVRVDANLGRVTIIADADHVEVRASSDDEIHIQSNVEEHSMSGGSYAVEDADEVTIYLPSSTREVSLSATGSAYIHSLDLENLSASNSEEPLSVSNVALDSLTITSLDGNVELWDLRAEEVDVTTTGSSVFLRSSEVGSLSATTASGDVDIDLPSIGEATITTSSGDVSIALDDISSYTCHLSDAEGVREIPGSGDGRISITTGSGSISLE